MVTGLPERFSNTKHWLQLVVAIASALGIAKGLGAWSEAIIARPWRLSRKIAQVTPGSRVESVSELLGPPVFGTTQMPTWVFPECFLKAALEDGQIVAFAVTLRRPWFRVTIRS